MSLARVVIAAPASGHGKTTVATGLMAALRRTGHAVSGHKVGPDYIDPGYHALATGRPGRNLDPHLVGEERLVPLLLHGAAHADIAIIEGVMGLHDGQIGGDGFASTAHVARVTTTPVVLVVDVSHASRSIAATVHGMVTWDPSVRVVGVILNKAGSQRHAGEVIRALETTGLPVLGTLFRDDGIVAPSRHLGLIPADERDDAVAAVDRLADRIATAIDLDLLMRLASAAPSLDAAPWDAAEALGGRVEPKARIETTPRIAIAGGRAFTFRYAETTELLEAAGCEVVTFDPLHDETLPEGTTGLYLGGGFPEMHASALSANEGLRASIRAAVDGGMPTVAECAGLLYLCRSVDGAPMVGAVAADGQMTSRLTLAYRTAVAPADHLLGPAGTRVTGHEFHRTAVEPAGDAAWVTQAGPMGFATSTLHASYLHTHWAGYPELAARFARAATTFDPNFRILGQNPPNPTTHSVVNAPKFESSELTGSDPLRHHGDAEVGEGLVDFAVNVFDGPRPQWLDDALRTSLDHVGAYPNPSKAERAIALRHGRSSDDVLATAGAAEAFGLIARLKDWRRPVVIHPQFTEPDVALATAGHRPEHVILDAARGFTLDAELVPDDADLVMVGNPTNPTSVLHPEASIRALLKPGRTIVVDEAFMDAVPAERNCLASTRAPGLVVVRSLTKLWSIPGVRAGYVLAESEVIAALRALQPPWSVSTIALAAMQACSTEDARAESAARADRLTRDRATLVDGLSELGIEVAGSPQAPFVLAHVGAGVHGRLRTAGYAVRRCDTFPGLDDSWIRIAVRGGDVTAKLLFELR
ncbi:MAG TPA: cobyrinate a,c-diamide synthase [Aeromicrobium sp.]|nr:cobyrinate a,c-diamide synthase [Aeromicrobium sp.]